MYKAFLLSLLAIVFFSSAQAQIQVDKVKTGKWKFTTEKENLVIQEGVSNKNVMQINADGDVYVAKNFIVNDKIEAEELKVKVTDFPDYVFHDDYVLKSIYEVEEHIEKHGHLPNVPKATTVESEGMDVGEMNRILMEKVEELTLYMIQQQKELDQLKIELKSCR